MPPTKVPNSPGLPAPSGLPGHPESVFLTGHGREPAERFFRDLVRSIQSAVLAIRLDGRIAIMNDAACRILETPNVESNIGRPWRKVLGSNPEIARLLAGAFDLSHLPNRAELRLRPSGKVIGYTLSHVRDTQDRVTGAVLFFKDLTRLEQLEERERLRDRLAALGEMAAAIAHEVKNPLAGIEVMAGVLRRQLTGSPDAQALLGDIISEAKVANGIVLEVLEFVRPIRLQVERIAVATVVREALAVAEAQTPGANVVVRLRIPPELPPIDADPLQLRQIFVNLASNAFEALSGRGSVEITALEIAADDPLATECPEPARVAIDVTDDGPGVPAEVRDRIFSPFFTTKPRGSGLGLAIVRKIVDAHDGRIDVSPAPGGGTRFRVTLPLASGSAREECRSTALRATPFDPPSDTGLVAPAM